eukprot:SAG11_NODE_1395_length_5038_cov_1.168050_2_plen_187_part_00
MLPTGNKQQLLQLFLEVFRLKKLWRGIEDAAAGLTHAILPESANDALGIEEPDKEDQKAKAEREQKLEQRNSVSHSDISDYYERQSHFADYEQKGTFDDFNEMAIQYGYVALFSPCFPLAPFFATLNNIIEIRGDSWKLCLAYQRPIWKSREDIGSWYVVLSIIGFVGVLTNATVRVAYLCCFLCH